MKKEELATIKRGDCLRYIGRTSKYFTTGEIYMVDNTYSTYITIIDNEADSGHQWAHDALLNNFVKVPIGLNFKLHVPIKKGLKCKYVGGYGSNAFKVDCIYEVEGIGEKCDKVLIGGELIDRKEFFLFFTPIDVEPASLPSLANDFKELCKSMMATYVKKNADYGSSFDKSLDKFGIVAAVVRIGDKMNRIESLTTKKAHVTDESIRDTLMDMANYCVMTVMWLDNQKKTCNL